MRVHLAVALCAWLPCAGLAGLDEGVAAYENEAYAQAVDELLPLAKAGNAQAMTWLGKAYAEGLEQPVLALPWLLTAAQSGIAEAQVRLAALYAEGRGVDQDDDKALAWLVKAAEQQDDEAQFVLGLHHEEEAGDVVAAVAWYEKAARQGNTDAQYRLGMLLLGDAGIRRDPVGAWAWLSLAADGGVEEAGEARDVLDLGMTPAQRVEASALLRQWQGRLP